MLSLFEIHGDIISDVTNGLVPIYAELTNMNTMAKYIHLMEDMRIAHVRKHLCKIPDVDIFNTPIELLVSVINIPLEEIEKDIEFYIAIIVLLKISYQFDRYLAANNHDTEVLAMCVIEDRIKHDTNPYEIPFECIHMLNAGFVRDDRYTIRDQISFRSTTLSKCSFGGMVIPHVHGLVYTPPVF